MHLQNTFISTTSLRGKNYKGDNSSHFYKMVLLENCVGWWYLTLFWSLEKSIESNWTKTLKYMDLGFVDTMSVNTVVHLPPQRPSLPTPQSLFFENCLIQLEKNFQSVLQINNGLLIKFHENKLYSSAFFNY